MTGETHKTNVLHVALAVITAALLLYFGPLVLVLLEAFFFDTSRCEELLRAAGLHDFYSEIYRPLEPVIHWFGRLLRP